MVGPRVRGASAAARAHVATRCRQGPHDPTSTGRRRGIFVAWHGHSRRAQLFGEALGLDVCLVTALRRRAWLAPVRYLVQAWRTLRLLARGRPCAVFVQNPPIFAALAAWLYTWRARVPLVIDVHTGALLAPCWRWSQRLHAFLSRRAAATLVTNRHLAELVEGWGARAIVVPDIPVGLPPAEAFTTRGDGSVAVVASFSPDEPLDVVFEAATALPDTTFYVTGSSDHADGRWREAAPPNVEFTGFLPDARYLGLLQASDAVVCLTTDAHTMQRGGCEAMALARPLITSDTELLREFFHRGTLHVANRGAELADAVRAARERGAELAREMASLREEHRGAWTARSREVVEALGWERAA